MSYIDNVRKVCVLAGILSPLIALLGISLAIYQNPWFSFGTNALSDLGASGILATFNIAVILSGMLSAIFFIALAYLFRKGAIFTAIGAIGALSLELLGIFNETYGAAHVAFSIAYFLLVPIAIIGISYKVKTGRLLVRYGLFAGLLSIIAVLLGVIFYSTQLMHGIGFAVNEGIEAILIGIWSIAMALHVSKKR